ncbi:MAG: flotillin-like FloA family protein [Pirellulaceae bacterium]
MVEAQADVPKAMAEGFRSGKLGIMDYYRLKNVEADTEMRRMIAGSSEPSKPEGTICRTNKT